MLHEKGHRFTEPLVERLIARTRIPKGKRDVVIPDDAMPGFFLRIFAGGAAVYGVRFRVGRQQRRMSLARLRGFDPRSKIFRSLSH
jgi:hypothetical protein